MANEIMTLTPAQVSVPTPEAVHDLLVELSDIGGGLELGRVKMASSGLPVFEVIEPGADESDTPKTIDAVILFAQKQNVRWPANSKAGSGDLPECRSYDGITGYDQAGMALNCATCPMNQFGSAPNGGKACKNTVVLYLIRPAEGDRPADLLPLKMTLPATSIRSFSNYRVMLSTRRMKMPGVLTRLSINKTKNKDGIEYGEAVFKLMGKLPEDQAVVMNNYAETFKAQMAPKPGVPAGFQQIVDEEDSPF